MDINKLCENEKENIIALRRDFHKYPEEYWREFRTTGKIGEYLTSFGYDVYYGNEVLKEEFVMNYPTEAEINRAKDFALNNGGNLNYLKKSGGYTGLAAVLDTGRAGKTTALRFDIDANEVIESTENSHRPFKEGFSSVNYGRAHCCGHDGHMAMGIALAKILSEIKNELCGKIIFIFQAGEESVAGGKSFSESDFLKNVDYFLSAHLGIKADKFTQDIVGVKGFLATKKIDVSFLGKSSHAGVSPQLGKNALLAASAAITAMYTICQDGRGSRRINVGTINGGTARNAIVDRLDIKMEVRGETNEICEDMYRECKKIIEHTSAMYGVTANIKVVGEAPGAESDSALANFCENIIKNLYPDHEVINSYDFGASEDVTFIMNRIQRDGGKSHYMMIGTELAAPHHNPKFDINEDSLTKGVKILANTVYRLQKAD